MHPGPNIIARGWLTDLIKKCREEIRESKRRVTQYEVWDRVHSKVDDLTEIITDDGEIAKLSPETEKETRAKARLIAEAAVRAIEIGLAVRL